MVRVRIETKPVIHPTVTKGPPAAVLQHTAMTCSNCTPVMFTKRPIFSFLSKEMRESKTRVQRDREPNKLLLSSLEREKNTNLSDGCFPLCFKTAVKLKSKRGNQTNPSQVPRPSCELGNLTKQTLSFFFEPRTRTGQAGPLLSPAELQLQW